MLRKTFFIAIVVALLFLIYRWINPSWADKLINKISSIREKNQAIVSQTWNLNTGNLVRSWINTSWDLAYEKILQSGTLISLTWKNENLTWNISTWNKISTWTKINTWSKTVAKFKTSKTAKATPTNTNWLSNQDMIDLKNLLNNIVE